MAWNVLYFNIVDVTFRYFAIVRFVSLSGEFIVVAGENAFSTHSFESDAKSTDTAKQIDESWRRRIEVCFFTWT